MAPVMNISGHWYITQDNGYTVDVSMDQDGASLTAVCSHSNGSVRCDAAAGTVTGNSFILTIPWNNGTRGEYTGALEAGHFTAANQGILKGHTKDLNNTSSHCNWEVKDVVFQRA